MTTSLHIHRGEPLHTVEVHMHLLGQRHSSSITGPLLYALVDGLLWYAINRHMEALVNSAVPPVMASHDPTLASTIEVGEAIVHLVYHTPFHLTEQEKALRIMNTLERRIPELEPLIQAGADPAARREVWQSSLQLATVLKQRMVHEGEAMYALEELLATQLPPAPKPRKRLAGYVSLFNEAAA